MTVFKAECQANPNPETRHGLLVGPGCLRHTARVPQFCGDSQHRSQLFRQAFWRAFSPTSPPTLSLTKRSSKHQYGAPETPPSAGNSPETDTISISLAMGASTRHVIFPTQAGDHSSLHVLSRCWGFEASPTTEIKCSVVAGKRNLGDSPRPQSLTNLPCIVPKFAHSFQHSPLARCKWHFRRKPSQTVSSSHGQEPLNQSQKDPGPGAPRLCCTPPLGPMVTGS